MYRFLHLFLSIPLVALPGASASSYALSQTTTTPSPSSTTAVSSLNYDPNTSNVAGQSGSSSSVPSFATLTPSSTPSSIPSPSSSFSPSASPVSTQNQSEMDTVLQRRLGFITASVTQVSKISSWLQTLLPNGSWPTNDIDYATGCDARRANWPASTHWSRILTMSAAWHGGVKGAEKYHNDSALATAISAAMEFWFLHDFTDPACLDQGNSSACRCGAPGFWNPNWYSNVIGVPELVIKSCLLFQLALNQTQVNSCISISARAYDTFYEEKSYLTGANILDVATIGVDLALFTTNTSLMTEAYGRINAQIVIEPGIMVDGIKPDGSFGQHSGLLYNGNYGKDFSNDVLVLQIDAAGTQYAADTDSQHAFETLLDADEWMVYRNVKTGVLHWDFSCLPRFISFPVIDAQATASLNINLSEILQLGNLWDSSTMVQVYHNLVESTSDANAGNLDGNRNFYSNDYMVQRGPGYVSTLKMYSNRTKNTECTNSENPRGFHLSDGALFTYLEGDEYEDIAAAWDWNLIPGTTLDYGATPLTCDKAQWTGIESFVGGVSNNSTGVAAMRYLNPYTNNLSWQKGWFFLNDGVQHVMTTNVTSLTNSPVYSVLDQRRHSGDIYVNGDPFNAPGNQTFNGTVSTLWHGGVGYLFEPGSTVLSLSVGNRTGAWSAIGISTQPPETVDLFAAWITHEDLTQPVSYTIFPATTTLCSFQDKSSSRQIITLQNDAHISAILDPAYDTISAIFWDAFGGTLSITGQPDISGPANVTVSGNVALMLNFKTGNLTISDPSQTLPSVNVQVVWLTGPPCIFTVDLPLGPGGLAGSSVTQTIFG